MSWTMDRAEEYVQEHTIFKINDFARYCRVMDGLSLLTELRKMGYDLVAIYERRGWWTSTPTEAIREIYYYYALLRNTAEQANQSRQHGVHSKGLLGMVANGIAAHLDSVRTDFEKRLPIEDREDEILLEVDLLKEEGLLCN